MFTIKLILAAFIAFLWFILLQGEYEMITKPELQNDFPIIKGVYAVYFLGFILLALAAGVIFLLFQAKKQKNEIIVYVCKH